MNYTVLLGIIIFLIIIIVRIIWNSKDEEMISQLNAERDLAYESAWKTFFSDYKKKYKTTQPFNFNGCVDPPILSIWYNDHFNERLDTITNFYNVYKFENGKWNFCKKKSMDNSLWFRLNDADICREFNCNHCTNYLHLKKNHKKLKYNYHMSEG